MNSPTVTSTRATSLCPTTVVHTHESSDVYLPILAKFIREKKYAAALLYTEFRGPQRPTPADVPPLPSCAPEESRPLVTYEGVGACVPPLTWELPLLPGLDKVEMELEFLRGRLVSSHHRSVALMKKAATLRSWPMLPPSAQSTKASTRSSRSLGSGDVVDARSLCLNAADVPPGPTSAPEKLAPAVMPLGSGSCVPPLPGEWPQLNEMKYAIPDFDIIRDLHVLRIMVASARQHGVRRLQNLALLTPSPMPQLPPSAQWAKAVAERSSCHPLVSESAGHGPLRSSQAPVGCRDAQVGTETTQAVSTSAGFSLTPSRRVDDEYMQKNIRHAPTDEVLMVGWDYIRGDFLDTRFV